MSRREAFVLRVNVQIEKVMVTERGEPCGGTGDRLSVIEDTVLPPSSFMAACEVLGRFHQLAEEVKRRAEIEAVSSR